MTINELLDRVLIKTGQHLYSANIEIDITKFKVIVQEALKTYSRYKPKRQRLFITLYNGRHTFVDNPPDDVLDLVPVEPYYHVLPFASAVQDLKWVYRKPDVYANFSGDAEVEAIYQYIINPDDTVDVDDDLFVDLVTALFLISIGRSRRAFTVEDIPISTDATDLVSEGQSLYDTVVNRLMETSILL